MRLPGHAGRPDSEVDDRHVENGSGTGAGGDAVARAQSEDGERYRLISIQAVRAPAGCSGSDWHVYRIAQGDNAITGYRRGDLPRVTAEVETIVTALNGRRQWAKPKALRR